MKTPPPDPWLTFGPDVLAGLISAVAAGIIVGVIFLFAQRISEARTRQEIKVEAAYEKLLEIASRLVLIDFGKYDETKMLSELHHRMMILSELVGKKMPEFGLWFEAERQSSLSAATGAAKAWEALEALPEQVSDEQLLEAKKPFLTFLRNFVNNVRYWRTGKLSPADMKKQADLIEANLRKEGRWMGPS
jgi:hypothetical protein